MRSRTIFAAFVITAPLWACTPSGATNTPTIGARAPSEELVFIRQPEPGTAQTRIETLEGDGCGVGDYTPDGSVRRVCHLARRVKGALIQMLPLSRCLPAGGPGQGAGVPRAGADLSVVYPVATGEDHSASVVATLEALAPTT